MLRSAGGTLSRIDLTKRAFLLSREAPGKGGSSFYNFVPYKYGPFSFLMHRETRGLMRDGFIEEPNHQTWSLGPATAVQEIQAPGKLKDDVAFVHRHYGHKTSKELLDLVYTSYPWFTLNSELPQARKPEKPVASVATYTIGYEGKHIDQLLNALIYSGIQRLVDVRRNPVSRQYGFHKSTLQELCSRLSIDYIHFPELGIPSTWRRSLESPSDYEVLFRAYVNQLLPQQASSVERISDLITEKPSALMCMEADPSSCHRSHLAEQVAERSQLPVVHL